MCKVWGALTRKGVVGKTITLTTLAYMLLQARLQGGIDLF